MRLDKFDLNLLVALEALLDEQSVTRAATRLNLTQPAMSAALARLRMALNDELLVPYGRRMVSTPHARDLRPYVTAALQGLRSLISGATAFDAATSDRRFTIAASDYVTTVLVVPALRELKLEAPRLQFALTLPTRDSQASLEAGQLDFMMTPEEFLSPDHPRELLFEERHVVVGWSKNPVFRQPLDEEAFYSCGHVTVQLGGNQVFVERILQTSQRPRRIEIVAPAFALVPWLLPETNNLAVMHERLAAAFEPLLPLKIVPLPFDVAPMKEMIQYHAAHAADPATQWVLRKILDVARLQQLL